MTNTYGYDAVGNRLSLQYGNGAYGFHIYDAINRLTNLTNYTDSGKTTKLSEFDYTLAADGMRVSNDETVEPSSGTAEPHYIGYKYDNLNRLVREIANDADITYTGDNPNNMTNGYIADYTYDLVGNRVYRHITVYRSSVIHEELHTKYDYDPATDRLNWEKHRNTQIAMAIPFGDEPVYAYADGSGGALYKTADGKSIGSFKAFMMGLPSKWGRYTLIGAWALLALVVLYPVLARLAFYISRKGAKLAKKENALAPSRLGVKKTRFSLFTRSICLLLAFLFIVGPNEFNTLARADVLYSGLDTTTWFAIDRRIDYTYDANGSLLTKITKVESTSVVQETVTYDYNLQNRLERVTTTSGGTDKVAEYTYNDAGIRVSKTEYSSGSPTQTILYLIDSFNHTGYAQPIAELTYNNIANPDPTAAADTVRSYVIGDDVLAQNDNPLGLVTPDYLLYDGHGSTRQLTDSTIDGTTDVKASYSYDAYGVMLGGKPSSPAATNLLYSGEQFDTDMQQYYLRARYYDQNNGRFNRVDPFGGNMQDPQSLHKYLYCHANPVNGIDPSGNMALGLMLRIGITVLLNTIEMAFYAFITSKIFATLAAVLAIAHLALLATDRDALEFFVASCRGDLSDMGTILAMDVMALRNFAQQAKGFFQRASTTRNVIRISHNVGSSRDHGRKIMKVQNAAGEGGVIYVGDTSNMQPDANRARQAYRNAIKDRLISWFQHKGNNLEEATLMAEQYMKNKHVDHKIDLQISGALKNPNARSNLGMLDASVNTSIGKQIELEAKKLGLKPGDTIDEIIVD